MAKVDASLRYFRKAATVLSMTLTSTSPVLSSHVHAAVDEGHALAHGARQLELEVAQAVIAHAAAKAHHGGFAHMGAVGQLGDRQVGECARVGQHQLAHALLGGASEGSEALIRSSIVMSPPSLQQKPSRAIMALDALGPQVPAA
jgi:hypothetical protein